MSRRRPSGSCVSVAVVPVAGCRFHQGYARNHCRVGPFFRGSAEPGLRGWVVYLDLNDNGRRDRHDASTTTDVNGDWRFDGLAAGTYRIGLVRKGQWDRTLPTKSILVTVDGLGRAVDNRFGVRRHRHKR